MAARLRDAGRPFSRQASIAKLVATDAAMKVTTDAVQVLGGYGYTRDFPAERYMREAKVTQIFEGTNQIQRMVIARIAAQGPVAASTPARLRLGQAGNLRLDGQVRSRGGWPLRGARSGRCSGRLGGEGSRARSR